eukprot:7360642-Prymnesium_polylepis.6
MPLHCLLQPRRISCLAVSSFVLLLPVAVTAAGGPLPEDVSPETSARPAEHSNERWMNHTQPEAARIAALSRALADAEARIAELQHRLKKQQVRPLRAA